MKAEQNKLSCIRTEMCMTFLKPENMQELLEFRISGKERLVCYQFSYKTRQPL